MCPTVLVVSTWIQKLEINFCRSSLVITDYTSHIKIFIILIKLIFQNNIFNKICGIFLIFFGDMATFAVEVWSWKLCQIKDPLVFGAAIRIVLRSHQNSAPTSAMIRQLYAARCFDSHNRGLQHQTPMDLSSGITSKTKHPQQQW